MSYNHKQLQQSIEHYDKTGEVDNIMIQAVLDHEHLLNGINSGTIAVLDTYFLPMSRYKITVKCTMYSNALNFYGKEENWEPRVDKHGNFYDPMAEDRGTFARKVLERPKL